MSSTLATITLSTITLLIGIFINRIFENKPRLIVYFGHTAAGRGIGR